MSDTKNAFRLARELSRAAALTGCDEAKRRRDVFFTSLARVAILHVLRDKKDLPWKEERENLSAATTDDDLRQSIADLPKSSLERATFLGWAYQVWNEPVRDANSWAVSRRAENRHEEVDIAAVTQVFTDEYIADFLVSRCVGLWHASSRRDEIAPRVCDPALGTGHMLVSAVKMFVSHGIPVDAIADRLYGFDIDPLAVFLARTAIFCELVRIGYSGEPAVLWERLGDSLTALPAPYGSLERGGVSTEKLASFDIIVTNPPYLGRRKLPSAFRDFLDREYPATSVDLCAAFLQRCIELLSAGGLLGVVASDKWMRLQRYGTVREGRGNFRGIFGELTIDSIYELGERAFSVESDLHDGMRAALLVGSKSYPPSGHQLAYMTLADFPSSAEKQEALAAVAIDGASSVNVTHIRQSELAKGGAVFLKLSGLPARFTKAVTRVSDHADIVVGVQTNDDARFVKYVWQARGDRERWRVHSKGGGYGRWAGLNRWVIDWQGGADEFFETDSARGRAESWAAQEGWVYSWLASGSLGLRRKEAGWTFGRAASGGVFTRDPRVVAFMNSRLASAAARSIGGKIQLPEGTVKAIPTPIAFDQIDDGLVLRAVQLKQRIVASDPTEALFCPGKMLKREELFLTEAVLLVIEAVLEQQVERCIGLSCEERRDLVGRLGMVAGWYSPAVPLESHPVLDKIPHEWRDLVEPYLTRSLDTRVSGRPRPSIEALKEVGDLRKLDLIIDGRWLHPSTGFVETICRAFQLHPFDAFLSAEELIRHSVGVSRRVCGGHLARWVLVELLGRLGHQWWSESEVGKQKVCERLSYEEVRSIVGQLVSRWGYDQVSEVMGVELDEWIQHSLLEFNSSCFLGHSPLVFESKDRRIEWAKKADV